MPAISNGSKGVTIVEILVIIAVIVIGLASLLALATFSLSTSTSVKEANQAVFLAQEAMEIVRNFRDNVSWNNNDPQDQYDGLGVLVAATAYHPVKSAGNPAQWMMIQGQETINGFTRQIIFDKVSRDPGTSNIQSVYNPVYDDSNTRKVTVDVTWRGKKIEIVTYFTNWK